MYIVRFVFVLASLYVFDATNNDSQSLNNSDLNNQQKYYVLKLENKLLRQEIDLQGKKDELDDLRTKVKQLSIYLHHTTFRNRVTFYHNLLRDIRFLQLCPQLLQTMKDLLYMPIFKKKNKNKLYQEIYNDTRTIHKKQRKHTICAFTRRETWYIYAHWMIFRLDENEHNNLVNNLFPSASKCFSSMQITFRSQRYRESLKNIVEKLYWFWKADQAHMACLHNRFEKWSTITAEVNADKTHYGSSYFLRKLLPGEELNDEFVSLAIWLMFRITPEDRELFEKSNCQQLKLFSGELYWALKCADTYGEAMASLWSKVNSKVQEFYDTLMNEKQDEYTFRRLEGDVFEYREVRETCYRAILDSEPINTTTLFRTVSQESKENNSSNIDIERT